MWYLGISLAGTCDASSAPSDVASLSGLGILYSRQVSMNGPAQMTDALYDRILTRTPVRPLDPYFAELSGMSGFDYFVFNRWSANEDTCVFLTDYATALKSQQLHPAHRDAPIYDCCSAIEKDGLVLDSSPPLPKPVSASGPDDDTVSRDLAGAFPSVPVLSGSIPDASYSDYLALSVLRVQNSNELDVSPNAKVEVLETWFGTFVQKGDPSRDYATPQTDYLPDVVSKNSDYVELYPNPLVWS